MPDIRISLGPVINEKDIERLRSSLENLGPDDQISIQMEAPDAHQTNRITNVLEREGFDYQPRGGNGTDFYFVAKKRLKEE